MGEPSRRTSELNIQTAVEENRASTIILIDGVSILDPQQQPRRDEASTYPAGPPPFLPANPVGLLPPDSAALLPTTMPRHAMIGICTCGEPGCSSMWVQVRREAGKVVWEPDPDTPDRTVDTTWRFELRQYLDALDEGQRSTASWETPPIRLARELRRRRDSLPDFPMLNSANGAELHLLDAVAWPGRDEILIRVASDGGLRQLMLTVDDSRTDQEMISQLHSVDPTTFL